MAAYSMTSGPYRIDIETGPVGVDEEPVTVTDTRATNPDGDRCYRDVIDALRWVERRIAEERSDATIAEVEAALEALGDETALRSWAEIKARLAIY